MSTSDRRVSHITIQQLRRHLRDADEDRYRLTAAAGRPPDSSTGPRLLGLLLLLIAGSGIAFRTAGAPHPVGQIAAASSTPFVEVAGMPAVVGVKVEDVAVRLAPEPAPKVRRPTAKRASALAPVKHGSRGAPRPLHPGEFGRFSR